MAPCQQPQSITNNYPSSLPASPLQHSSNTLATHQQYTCNTPSNTPATPQQHLQQHPQQHLLQLLSNTPSKTPKTF